nr:hypothetical protein CKG001_17590 [Bdellovibrio sp. CKG001]
MTDIEIGREALRHFHNASLKFDSYEPDSLDELISYYGKKKDIYLDGVGMVIRENNMSQHAVEGAMQTLAKQAQGRIPKDHQGYVSALGNQASKISWLDLTSTVAVETVSTVAKGAQSLGDNVVSTLKVANWIWPIALFAFVGLWYFGKVKKHT